MAGDAARAAAQRLEDERFLAEAGLALPRDAWDRAAHIINSRQGSYPELAAICREIKKAPVGDACFPLYMHAKAVETAALLFAIAFKLEEKEAAIATRKSREAAKHALAILDERFVEPPSVEELAHAVGVDKNTLQKGFRQMVGRTVHEYVRALRMEKALVCLEDDGLRIEDIARLTGYQSKVHFFNAFKSVYGCTPGLLAGRR